MIRRREKARSANLGNPVNRDLWRDIRLAGQLKNIVKVYED